MPYTMVANDVIEVAVLAFTPRQISVNLWHYKVSVTSTGFGTDAEAATWFDSQFGPLYKPLMGAGATYKASQVTVLRSPGPMPVSSVTNAGAGTAAGDLLPTQTTGLITKQTDFRGREFRGRVYIPFPSEGSNDASGLPSNAYVALLAALGTNMLATQTVPAAAGGNTLYIPVLRHGRVIPAVTTPITNFRANQKWGEQHRRGDYGQPNI